MVVNAKDSTVPTMEDFKELHNLVTHHIESFDYMTLKGLDVMFNRIKPVSVYDPNTENELSNILFFFVLNLLYGSCNVQFLFVLCLISLTSMILWLENPLVFAPQKESFKSTSRKEPLLPFEVKFFCFEHVSEVYIFCWCVSNFGFGLMNNSVGKRRFRTQERLWLMFALSIMMESLLETSLILGNFLLCSW